MDIWLLLAPQARCGMSHVAPGGSLLVLLRSLNPWLKSTKYSPIKKAANRNVGPDISMVNEYTCSKKEPIIAACECSDATGLYDHERPWKIKNHAWPLWQNDFDFEAKCISIRLSGCEENVLIRRLGDYPIMAAWECSKFNVGIWVRFRISLFIISYYPNITHQAPGAQVKIQQFPHNNGLWGDGVGSLKQKARIIRHQEAQE